MSNDLYAVAGFLIGWPIGAVSGAAAMYCIVEARRWRERRRIARK